MRRLPWRYRDILPEPLPPLPPIPQDRADLPITPSSPRLSTSNAGSSSPSQLEPIVDTSTIQQTTETPRNTFGLIRQYASTNLPHHDPEEYLDVQALSDEPHHEPDSAPTALNQHPNQTQFFPYPNQSSFLLGDWYWSHGAQKSRASFTQLLKIVGHPEFYPEDVRRTNWNKIDAKLGSNPFDSADRTAEDGEEEWMDEGAGWHRTSISISVPFHSYTKAPGPKDYHVGDLYH